MQKRSIARLLGALAAGILAAGCTAAAPPVTDTPAPSAPAAAPAEESAVPVAALPQPEPVAAEPVPKGTGSIRYDGDAGEALDDDQEALLLSYMDLYHQSLADLTVYDPAEHFAADATEQVKTRISAVGTMVAVRGMQRADLSLTAFSYTLTVTAVGQNDDGDTTVRVREDAVQNFAAFPGMDSESVGAIHSYTLTDTAGGWKLRAHSQMMDSGIRLAVGSSGMRAGSWGGGSASGSGLSVIVGGQTGLDQRRETLLAAHRQQLAQRLLQTGGDTAPGEGIVWEHNYDREAAVAYALQWVGRRNSDQWPTYDRSGGNCQNYTSQCLYAGGIPMDYTGRAQWKWYGDTNNAAQTAAGRSGSWSSVSEFYSYVRDNQGYGMAAEADANFWAGEPGDLIQLGNDDNWRHVVIITHVLRDGEGNAVDYLISSNTADLRNFPVSAYLYPQQRLIKIYGWNSSGR